MTNEEKAASMLGVIQAVHDGGKAIIGSSWWIHEEMATLARAGDVDAMVRCFLTYSRSNQGIRLGERLRTYGKPTLEAAQRRFMGIARSG
jgi:hypothetical protein